MADTQTNVRQSPATAKKPAVNTQQVYTQSAVLSKSASGKKSVILNLRTSYQGNAKGQNSFPATTTDASNHKHHGVILSAEPTKSGAHKGTTEAQRVADAAGFGEEMKEVLDNFDHYREESAKTKGRVPALEGKGFKINAFNSRSEYANDPKFKNAIYYTNAKGDIVNGLNRDPQSHFYTPNPEARFARFGNVENTIKPDPSFDFKKEAQLVADARAAKAATKNVDVPNAPQKGNAAVAKAQTSPDVG